MVTIGAPGTYPRARLGALIAARDASLVVSIGTMARLTLAARSGARGMQRGVAVLSRLTIALLTICALAASRHGLVLAGLSAWTWAAWSYSPIAGGITLGAVLMFLELRRR